MDPADVLFPVGRVSLSRWALHGFVYALGMCMTDLIRYIIKQAGCLVVPYQDNYIVITERKGATKSFRESENEKKMKRKA